LNSFQGIISYEDPVAALNLSDQKWNEIVQKQVVDFHKENARKVKDRLSKSKAIMEEQKKQIEEKRKNKDKIKM